MKDFWKTLVLIAAICAILVLTAPIWLKWNIDFDLVVLVALAAIFAVLIFLAYQIASDVARMLRQRKSLSRAMTLVLAETASENGGLHAALYATVIELDQRHGELPCFLGLTDRFVVLVPVNDALQPGQPLQFQLDDITSCEIQKTFSSSVVKLRFPHHRIVFTLEKKVRGLKTQRENLDLFSSEIARYPSSGT